MKEQILYKKEKTKPRTTTVECIEKGRFCMGRFVPTRVGQTDTCIKCMEMLDGEIPPLPVSKVKRNLWN